MTKLRDWIEEQLSIPLELKQKWTVFTIQGNIIDTFEGFMSLLSHQLWQLWLTKTEAICPSTPQIYHNRFWYEADPRYMKGV